MTAGRAECFLGRGSLTRWSQFWRSWNLLINFIPNAGSVANIMDVGMSWLPFTEQTTLRSLRRDVDYALHGYCMCVAKIRVRACVDKCDRCTCTGLIRVRDEASRIVCWRYSADERVGRKISCPHDHRVGADDDAARVGIAPVEFNGRFAGVIGCIGEGTSVNGIIIRTVCIRIFRGDVRRCG